MVQGRRRMLRAALGACAAAGLAACDKLNLPQAGQSFRGIDITGAPYGRDFKLPDADGKERTLADFRGKLVLLYFGFVQCPDVCPTALTRAVETRRLLGADGERLQVVFITVDPERDTPEVLKAYMAAFDPSFVALRPSPEQLKATAAEFKAYYKAVPTGSSYTMDHSALSYIFDAQGRLRLALRHEQTAQDYAHDIALLMSQKTAG
ncbi:SCO family protein [Ottowia testudinis]|uniref:SCO family protein n=2 Tax=Ottowia testudinis TaxID=2816950 RepID=A0A975H527_9BURK|nr:SCO family protein [Ottowia testudinis]QTD47493.1 SCO family protein [Ottowia testudinis]